MTTSTANLITVVDMSDRPVGAQPIEDIKRHILPHRRVIVAAHSDQPDHVLVSVETSASGAQYDVAYSTDVRQGETYEHAAERAACVLGLCPAGVMKVLPPTPGNAYAFTQLIFVRDAPGHPTRFRTIEARSLACLLEGIIAGSVQCSYRLVEVVAALQPDDELADLIEHWWERHAAGAPVDAVSPVSDDEYRSLRAEILHHVADGRTAPWMNDLLQIYDNQMPQYPAPDGLEIGPVILSAEAIDSGLDRIADTLMEGLSQTNGLRLVAKLRSGALVANELERRLEDRGVEVLRYDVRSVWDGYCTSRIVGSTSRLTPMLNVICDTMISTGVTQGTIAAHLTELGAGSDFVAVALVARHRPRIFEPPRTLFLTMVTGNDWLVGYNSDAIAAGIEYCRALPFVAVLKPVGQGFRSRLLTEDWS